MSSSSRSRRSISKQRGAAMSSRLTPPYTGASALTMEMISSVSVVSRQTGQASTSANRLNSAALPSITGNAAAAPMSPRPSTAVPSVTTATVLRLMVSRRASAGLAAIARHTRATPGVYARERSSRLRSSTLGSTDSFPPRCIKKVRSLTLRTSTPSSASTAAATCSAWSSPEVLQVMSTTKLSCVDSITSRAVISAPAEAAAAVNSEVALNPAGAATRIVIAWPGVGRDMGVLSSRPVESFRRVESRFCPAEFASLRLVLDGAVVNP